jgi:hypothetical protein
VARASSGETAGEDRAKFDRKDSSIERQSSGSLIEERASFLEHRAGLEDFLRCDGWRSALAGSEFPQHYEYTDLLGEGRLRGVKRGCSAKKSAPAFAGAPSFNQIIEEIPSPARTFHPGLAKSSMGAESGVPPPARVAT